jgi:hypothetical protein
VHREKILRRCRRDGRVGPLLARWRLFSWRGQWSSHRCFFACACVFFRARVLTHRIE